MDGTNDLWYGNGKEVTEDWSNEFLSENNNMSVSYTDNDELIKISVQAKKSNGQHFFSICSIRFSNRRTESAKLLIALPV